MESKIRQILPCMRVALLAAALLFLIAGRSEIFSETEVKVAARLADEKIPMNREALCTVDVKWVGTPGEIVISPVDPPQVTNLKIVSTASSNRVFKEGGNTVTIRRYSFFLKGETLGMAYIDEVKIRYTDADGTQHTLRTPRLQLEIIAPEREPLQNYSFPLAAGGVLLMIGASFAVLYLQNRRKKRAEQASAAAQTRILEEVFLEKLRQEVSLQTKDFKLSYSNLSTLVRKYIREALALEPGIGTTEEIVAQLTAHGFEMEKIAVVQEILQACDVIKFSGGEPDPNRLARFFTLFEEFLKSQIASTATV